MYTGKVLVCLTGREDEIVTNKAEHIKLKIFGKKVSGPLYCDNTFVDLCRLHKNNPDLCFYCLSNGTKKNRFSPNYGHCERQDRP